MSASSAGWKGCFSTETKCSCVADDSASVLTDETIRIRQSHPELTRAQALQHAMKTVRTGMRVDGTALPNYFPSFAHPADWAPFTVIANYDE